MRGLAPLTVAWLHGCASIGTFQTADVLDPGRWEVGADASALVLTGSSGDAPVVAMPRGWVRVGLAERLDLGGSVGLDGLRVQPKLQLTRGHGPIFSVAPAVKVLPIPASSGLGVLAGLEESFLLGIPMADRRLQAVFVARSAQDVGLVDTSRAFLLWGGGGAGLSWQVAPAFRLMPAASVMVPLLVHDNGGDSGFGGGAVFQIGLGAGVGRR